MLKMCEVLSVSHVPNKVSMHGCIIYTSLEFLLKSFTFYWNSKYAVMKVRIKTV